MRPLCADYFSARQSRLEYLKKAVFLPNYGVVGVSFPMPSQIADL